MKGVNKRQKRALACIPSSELEFSLHQPILPCSPQVDDNRLVWQKCLLPCLGTAIYQLHSTTSTLTGEESNNQPRYQIRGEETLRTRLTRSWCGRYTANSLCCRPIDLTRLQELCSSRLPDLKMPKSLSRRTSRVMAVQ